MRWSKGDLKPNEIQEVQPHRWTPGAVVLNAPHVTPADDALIEGNPKLYEYEHRKGLFAFHCPGCGHDHCFSTVPEAHPLGVTWAWNGSTKKPTFAPSLLVAGDTPEWRCHSFVNGGRIQFLADSWHPLKGQTVDIPDWET